jgi:hypothetical protein
LPEILLSLDDICDKNLGDFFHDLIADFSWVSRKVEIIRILDSLRWEHKVSLDLDVDKLHERIERHSLNGHSFLPIPIGIFDKNLLVDFDVSESNTSLHMLTSDEDSTVSSNILFSLLVNSCDELNVINDIPEEIRKFIYSIVRSNETDIFSDIASSISKLSGQDESEWWKYVDTVDMFSKWLVRLSSSYIPMVMLNTTKPNLLIKYCLVQPTSTERELNTTHERRLRRFFNRITGRRGKIIVVEDFHFGYAQREHLKICAPDGTEISGAPEIVDYIHSGNDTEKNKFYGRVTPERTIVYAQLEQPALPGQFSIKQEMRPGLAGFYYGAMYSLFLNTLILFLVGFWPIAKNTLICLSEISLLKNIPIFFRLTESTQTLISPLAGLLPTIPSLYSVYLAQTTEHPLRSWILAPSRSMVRFSAISTAGLLLWISLRKMNSPLFWWLASLSTVITLFSICTWISRGKKAHSKVRKVMNITHPLEIKLFPTEEVSSLLLRVLRCLSHFIFSDSDSPPPA